MSLSKKSEEPTDRSAAEATDVVKAALAQERARLAQRLHDTVCQDLTGISLLATAAARQRDLTVPEARQRMEEMAELLSAAGVNLSTLVRDLRREGTD